MGAELAKPVALTLCLVSLYAVFHAAFLVPASHLEDRIFNSLELLAVTAGICVASGLIFRDSAQETAPAERRERVRLCSTLPLQLFRWGLGLMLILFVASWYLETYCVFYREVQRR